MKFLLKTKDKKIKFKGEADSIDEFKDIVKMFCQKNKVIECDYKIEGGASIKVIDGRSLPCLIG